MKQGKGDRTLIFQILIIILLAAATTSWAQIDNLEEPLRGVCSRDSLQMSWPEFQPGFYDLSQEALEYLRGWQDPISIQIFFGTWCSDSKRELPRFFQIIDEIQNKNFSFELFGLDRSKRDETGRAESFGIESIPTFIFMAKGLEIGRIVEEPEVNLESDWARVLKHYQETGLPISLDNFLQVHLAELAISLLRLP